MMASPSLRDEFSATVELYSTFIKQMKAENPQLNVSEVSFALGKAGKNSFGKRNFTGISNVSNAAVDNRLGLKLTLGLELAFVMELMLGLELTLG
jgi:hypothetical protein